MTSANAERPRPLVAQHGAIGDTIQLTAMLAALARRWRAPCDVVSGCGAAPAVLAGLDTVGEVRTLSTRKVPYWLSGEQRRLVRWLATRGPGPAWVVERWRHPIAPWSESTRLEWLLERAGLGAASRVSTRDRRRGELEHAVDYQRRLAALDPPAFGGVAGPLPDPPPAPALRVSAAETADCRAWLAGRGWDSAPPVLLQAGARRRNRGRWPAELWRRLVEALLAARPRAPVLFIGSAAEAEEAGDLAAAAGDPRVAAAAGELPLRRLFALLTLADSLVSLDSAPAHAASALGCPVVVLAGTADPRRNRPVGPAERIRVVSAFDGGAWPDDPATWFARHRMEEIPLAAVVGAWRGLAPARDAPR